MEAEYVRALCREIMFYGTQFPGLSVNTIFFGGGTPNLLRVAAAEQIMASIYAAFDVADDAEITMEMNPWLGCVGKVKSVSGYGDQPCQFRGAVFK